MLCRERTLVSSVAELMKEAPAKGAEAAERVEWVAFLESDLDRDAVAAALAAPQPHPPLLLALGLARGYQIWALLVHLHPHLIYAITEREFQGKWGL